MCGIRGHPSTDFGLLVLTGGCVVAFTWAKGGWVRAPRRRPHADVRRWRAAPGVAIGVAAWLPFIIGAPGSLKALRPTVHIAPDSLLDLVGLTDQSLPAWMRIAQLAACLAIGAILVARNRPESVIAAAVAVRIATDPATWSYYTPGLVIGVLIWDLLDRRRFPWVTFVVVVGLAPTWLVPSDTLRAVLRAAVAVAVVVWAVLRPPAWTATPRRSRVA